jgi:uncharacterized protein (DUF362 family)
MIGMTGKTKTGVSKGMTAEESVQKAIVLAGGLDFIEPGSTVLVKPNVNSDDPPPATTSPAVLSAVIAALRERRPARIIVGDRSVYWGNTIEYMKTTGIYDAARLAGAEVVDLEQAGWVQARPRGASSWGRAIKVSKLAREADYIVSIPVIKAHKIAQFSIGLKNTLGMVCPADRLDKLHEHNYEEPAFGNMVAEANLALRPDFVVTDSTSVMVRGGPFFGETFTPGMVVASRDIVANDAVGLAIMKALGTKAEIQEKSPWDQSQIRRAVELGLGAQGPADIELHIDCLPDMPDMEEKIKVFSGVMRLVAP